MQKRLDDFKSKTLEQDKLLAEVAAYQRQTDPQVDSLLNEFKKGPEAKKEHKGKWMQKGDSPTKRLMGK